MYWDNCTRAVTSDLGEGVLTSKQGPVRILFNLGLADHPKRLVFRSSLGANGRNDVPPLVRVGQGVANVRASISASVIHLELLGLDKSLDLANLIAVVVGVDPRELAGAVPGCSCAILTSTVLTSTVLTGGSVSAVDLKFV